MVIIINKIWDTTANVTQENENKNKRRSKVKIEAEL